MLDVLGREMYGISFDKFIIFIGLAIFYEKSWDTFRKSRSWITHLIAVIFSACMLIGISYSVQGSWAFIMGSKYQIVIAAFSFAGYFILFDVALSEISLPKSYISPSNFSAEDAYRYVLRVMKQKSRPTALLCCNNVMAEGALRAIGELGLKIYDDVSLVAFGSQDWNKYLMPKITSIEMDSCDMGERAGSIMVDMINSGPKIAAKMILSGRLMEGGSVKKLSLET